MKSLAFISQCIHHKQTVLELQIGNLRDTDLAWALLAACSELTELRLRHSLGVTSIRILEQLPKLEILHLDLPNVADLSVLQKLPKLKHLYISRLSTDVLATLQALPQLELLHLSQIHDKKVGHDFTFLERLANLKELRIGFCSLTDVDFLSPLKKLEKLMINGNMLEDISPLSQLEHLNYLDISHNYIRDFSPLLACRKLAFISAFDNKFTSLPDMSNLQELTFLDVSECRLSDLSPLLALPLLDHLFSYDNPIKVVPPAPIVHFLGQLKDNNPPLKDFLLQREPPQIEQIWQLWVTGQADNIFLAEQLAIAADWTEDEIRVYTKFADRHLREG